MKIQAGLKDCVIPFVRGSERLRGMRHADNTAMEAETGAKESHSVKEKKPREYLFDNYKVFLIFLVVVGHFIEPSYENNPYLYELKWAIMAFHMPAFIFVSGYFSKKVPSIKKLMSSLVIPYLVYEVVYYLLYTFFLDKETGLYLARPKFSLWYLMALFVWRVITPWVKKIPGYFLLSVVAGLLVGFSELDNFLSIPRILYFFPFFLAGTAFDIEWINRFRNKYGFAAALTALAGFTFFLFEDDWHRNTSIRIFYGRFSYAEMDMGSVEGMLVRLGCYAVSFLLVYLFMLVIPREKRSYSYLGRCTMAVYIFHGLIYNCLKYKTNLLSKVHTNEQSLLLILFCVFLVWFLSRKPFVKVTDRIANLI